MYSYKTHSSVPKVCFKDQGSNSYIEMTIKNGVSSEVQNIHTTIIGSKTVHNIDSTLTNVLGKAEARIIKITYNMDEFGTIEKIQITPMILLNGEEVLCSEGRWEVENIRACS